MPPCFGGSAHRRLPPTPAERRVRFPCGRAVAALPIFQQLSSLEKEKGTSFFPFSDNQVAVPERRLFLGSALLSGAAVALLAGRDVLAATESRGVASDANDANILNTALGAELEAVAAYQVAAESGLLEKPVLLLAT